MIWQRVISPDDVELTFILPGDHPAIPVGVAGEFNDWQWERTPFHDQGGCLVACIIVTAGVRYRLRYRAADGTWFNDDHADDYVDHPYGGVDSVFDTSTKRRELSALEVRSSPNHRAMLDRIAGISADRHGEPVSEDDIVSGMAYTLGSHPATTLEAGPSPLSHLLADLASADLIQRHATSGPDQRPTWTVTSAGTSHLRNTDG
jgi:hypothetical protein